MTQRLTALAFGSTLVLCAGLLAAPSPSAGYDPDRFEKEVLVAACEDPMEIEVLGDGRVLFIKRRGAVMIYRPADRRVVMLGTVPVCLGHEVGLMGLASDPHYERSGSIYLALCPIERKGVMRIARFTVREDRLDLASQRIVLESPIDIDDAIHMGGGLAVDGEGNLLMGTGDNSPPVPALPVDQRPGLMPAGLLSTLSLDEVLDLLASLESGGDPRGPAFLP